MKKFQIKPFHFKHEKLTELEFSINLSSCWTFFVHPLFTLLQTTCSMFRFHIKKFTENFRFSKTENLTFQRIDAWSSHFLLQNFSKNLVNQIIKSESKTKRNLTVFGIISYNGHLYSSFYMIFNFQNLKQWVNTEPEINIDASYHKWKNL